MIKVVGSDAARLWLTLDATTVNNYIAFRACGHFCTHATGLPHCCACRQISMPCAVCRA